MVATRIATIFLVSVGLIFSASSMRHAANKTKLRLGVMIAREGELDYSGELLSFDLALQTINSDPSLQYSFENILNDSMVSASYEIQLG